MADLRNFVETLGFEDVRTLLQTGNIVFEGKAQSPAAIEARLESEAKKRLGLDTDFFVRTDRELAAIVTQNPFPNEAERDPSHLVVQFLKVAPPATAAKTLLAAIVGPEYVRAIGKQLYVVYPDGIGRSKLTAKLMESKLGTRATGRNWNTVLKLAALPRS